MVYIDISIEIDKLIVSCCVLLEETDVESKEVVYSLFESMTMCQISIIT